MTTFPTHAEAVAHLVADGFRASTLEPGLYVGPRSMTHGYEPIPTVAVVEIKRHAVAPAYGGGEFYSLYFH